MNLDNELLALIHRETVRLESVPALEPLRADLSNWLTPTPAWQADRWLQEDLRAGFGIRLALWFGPSPAARARCQRCLTRLERAGLVQKITSGPNGVRTTRVRLTEAGRERAEKLSA